MTFEEAVQFYANDLIEKYIAGPITYVTNVRNRKDAAKQCALIAVEAQLEAIEDFGYTGNFWHKPYKDGRYRDGDYEDASKFFNSVKQAIISFE